MIESDIRICWYLFIERADLYISAVGQHEI